MPDQWKGLKMSFELRLEDYTMTRTRVRVTYAGHLVTFFDTMESARKFVAYCEETGIYCRRHWVDKARPDVKMRYTLSNGGGGDLAVVPFTF